MKRPWNALQKAKRYWKTGLVGVAMASSKPTPPGKFGSSSYGEGYSEGLDGVPPSVIRWTLDADYRLGRMAGQREGRQATE